MKKIVASMIFVSVLSSEAGACDILKWLFRTPQSYSNFSENRRDSSMIEESRPKLKKEKFEVESSSDPWKAFKGKSKIKAEPVVLKKKSRTLEEGSRGIELEPPSFVTDERTNTIEIP